MIDKLTRARQSIDTTIGLLRAGTMANASDPVRLLDAIALLGDVVKELTVTTVTNAFCLAKGSAS